MKPQYAVLHLQEHKMAAAPPGPNGEVMRKLTITATVTYVAEQAELATVLVERMQKGMRLYGGSDLIEETLSLYEEENTTLKGFLRRQKDQIEELRAQLGLPPTAVVPSSDDPGSHS